MCGPKFAVETIEILAQAKSLRACESRPASRVESRLIRFAGPHGHWPALVVCLTSTGPCACAFVCVSMR